MKMSPIRKESGIYAELKLRTSVLPPLPVMGQSRMEARNRMLKRLRREYHLKKKIQEEYD